MLGEAGPLPCTPVGVIELLRRHDVPIAGAEVVVVGRGLTVGRPLGLLLTRRSENATVTLCHTGTRDLAAHVRNADIVVAAAGVPGIITGDMVKPGAAVLDVGVSRVDGKIAGDVADDVWDVAGWVSPNPGGVGPMTRAMLLSNIVDAAETSRWRDRCREPTGATTPDRRSRCRGVPHDAEPGGATRRRSAARSTCRCSRRSSGSASPDRPERLAARGPRGRRRAVFAAAWSGWCCRQRDAGMLAVRRRLVDVLMLAGVGGGLFFLAGVDPQPAAV